MSSFEKIHLLGIRDLSRESGGKRFPRHFRLTAVIFLAFSFYVNLISPIISGFFISGFALDFGYF